jgi:hypothetical protein
MFDVADSSSSCVSIHLFICLSNRDFEYEFLRVGKRTIFTFSALILCLRYVCTAIFGIEFILLSVSICRINRKFLLFRRALEELPGEGEKRGKKASEK